MEIEVEILQCEVAKSLIVADINAKSFVSQSKSLEMFVKKTATRKR